MPRRFGSWDLVTIDLASGEKAYVNRISGVISEDPPDEVLDILEAENRKRRLQQIYAPTSFRFAPFHHGGGHDLSVACHEVEEEDSAPVCRCCGDCGVVEGLGICPLCDGLGSEGWWSGGASGTGDGTPPMNSIERIDLLEGDGRAMLLQKFLSPLECCDLIEQAERFGLRSCGYSAKIRVSDRVVVMGEDLAATLFERAQPYLGDIEIWQDSSGTTWPLGARRDARPGVWSPTGLNPCFRVCRYDPGGFFLPHHDEGFDYDREHLSLKTFMIYLNDVFEGAPTTFYNDRQRHYREPDPSTVLYALHPERGSCVIFNQRTTHDGGRLVSGQKYILRTEVMYRYRGRQDQEIDQESDLDEDSDFA